MIRDESVAVSEELPDLLADTENIMREFQAFKIKRLLVYYRNFFNNHEITSVKIFRVEEFKMADSKKSSLLQAVGKLKNAKKNVSAQNDNTKSAKPNNSADGALKTKIKDAVSKFEGKD